VRPRERLPVHPPEPAPLPAVPRVHPAVLPVDRRHPGVRRVGRRHADPHAVPGDGPSADRPRRRAAPREHGAAHRLLAVVPLAAAPRRREDRLLLMHPGATGSVHALAAADRPEPEPHVVGVDQPDHGHARRRLRAPAPGRGGDRPGHPPAGLARGRGVALLREAIDQVETHPYDVVVIGAGGAGIRAAIEAKAAGASVALVCKSLFGKAHTVMAEGGVAAALAHVDPEDRWQTHFRDTMVGGKLLNNPRMAELHAKEAPDRVRELEAWGAVFDRTRDGRILQRPFGGHSHPRLAHVGDRTGLEMIRTLQDRAVAVGIDVFMECTITRLITSAAGANGASESGAVVGAFGYWRTTGAPVVFPAKAVVLATGGIGKAYTVTSNSWEYSGDGHALAYSVGADLIDMEFVQFHPTGMVWPPGVRGLLVTEAVRGEGGILRNKDGKRFMSDYLPEDRRGEYASTDEEAAKWVTAQSQGRVTDARRPPELSTRDNVSRAIYTEVREGRGSPHGGVFLDISYLPAEHVRRKLPSMYDQFKELADVDITKGPMEVGPTTHYVMGGVRVDAETGASTTPGLFAAGEVAGGMHGANRLGGNSLSDLLVFGMRTGAAAAAYAMTLPAMPTVQQS